MSNKTTLTRREIDYLYRLDFYSFMRAFVNTADPSIKLVPARYLEVICHDLEQVACGNILRYIANMPPRHLKSMVTSALWVAWLLILDPSKKIAVICYDESLATQLARACKAVLTSDRFKALALQVRIQEGRDRLMDFETTAKGRVLFKSIESGLTGSGFDIIILDDPQPANQAGSKTERERVHALFAESVSTRLNNPSKGAIVVVQQRLHEDDLSGYLLSRGGWRHLSLPLVAPEQAVYSTKYDEWYRPAGDVLIPELYTDATINNLQAEKGRQVFYTQYQQTPSSIKGGVLESHHLISIEELPKSVTTKFVAVDTAAKALASSDYTVFMVIATDYQRHFILDVVRRRVDILEMADIALNLCNKHAVQAFLIEDSANGPALASILQRKGKNAELRRVRQDCKEQRLRNHIHLFISGAIYLVGDGPWIGPARYEFESFPLSKFDDQVDAFTLYLDFVAGKFRSEPCIVSSSMVYTDVDQLYTKPRGGGHPMRPRFFKR